MCFSDTDTCIDFMISKTDKRQKLSTDDMTTQKRKRKKKRKKKKKKEKEKRLYDTNTL